ncbi:hypothetical protein AA13595_1118 [Gluconacetobacter johannae DSM 13595]|uniref:Uncharacterized protein n=1 Tax=Gluconacetobacter johannae TaxID=112140 RepID=A0A7W4J6M3_9PROT|nr:hypothetical protein [Gluconacetobacter johannae]MBB2175698.1 hypothetical protein [Gluconacetobacter johannae]GBQ83187.1 hypothetical protein AA13595_1118 [Gluconacetobacter johannae DSM 13595]
MEKIPNRAWFKPKTFGYGASPASWQGWLATAIFVVVFLAATLSLRGVGRWIADGVLLAGFVALVYAKTDGEWRWRGL